MAEGDDREDSDNNQADFTSDSEEIPQIDNIQIDSAEELDEFEEDVEYQTLDSQLDQLHACLNDLEARNDDLVTKLLALLADSKQTQQELQELRRSEAADSNLGRGAHNSGAGES